MYLALQKMLKKQDMTREMLELRQQILDETVEFMIFVNKYNLNLSISDHIYNKYTNNQKLA